MTHGSWPMQPNGESNQDVCSYGNSSLRFGVTKLSPKRGVVATTRATAGAAPLAGSNGVADLSRELAYARAHSPLVDLQLADGTEAFTADVVGAILAPG